MRRAVRSCCKIMGSFATVRLDEERLNEERLNEERLDEELMETQLKKLS